MKKRGFTDKLYFLNLTLSWLFIVICILITIFSGKLGITDLSIVSVGLPAVFAELGIHTGFIIWKAKTENISKFGYDPDNGREVTFGFVASEEEDTNDNNTIHNNAYDRSRSDIIADGSNKKGIRKCWKRIFGKHGSLN